MELSAQYLLFNASIVLLIALLCGVPYGQAITKKKGDEVIRAWRLAHNSLSMGATTMIAIAAVLSFAPMSAGMQWVIAIAFIISGYGFCFALTLEPFVGDRGLSWTGKWSNKVVFLGNVVGASSSLIGAVVLVYASYLSI